jgi:hypothetical protein
VADGMLGMTGEWPTACSGFGGSLARWADGALGMTKKRGADVALGMA